MREVLAGMSEAVAAAPVAVKELRAELQHVAELATSTQRTAAGESGSPLHVPSSSGYGSIAPSKAVSHCLQQGLHASGYAAYQGSKVSICGLSHASNPVLLWCVPAGMASAVGATGDALEVQVQRTAALAQRVASTSTDLACLKDTVYGPGSAAGPGPVLQRHASSSGAGGGGEEGARPTTADQGAPGSVSLPRPHNLCCSFVWGMKTLQV